MAKSKSREIIVPNVKPSEFFELYNIHYGDKGEFIKVRCNIEKEDLEKEIEHYCNVNYQVCTDVLVFDFPEFLCSRGYRASIVFDIEPVDVNFPKVD